MYRNIHSLQDCLILQEDLDSVPERWFEKVNFDKSQQMTTKVLKLSSVQKNNTCKLIELFTFLRVYLLYKRMPDSNKYTHVWTKS